MTSSRNVSLDIEFSPPKYILSWWHITPWQAHSIHVVQVHQMSSWYNLSWIKNKGLPLFLSTYSCINVNDGKMFIWASLNLSKKNTSIKWYSEINTGKLGMDNIRHFHFWLAIVLPLPFWLVVQQLCHQAQVNLSGPQLPIIECGVWYRGCMFVRIRKIHWNYLPW